MPKKRLPFLSVVVPAYNSIKYYRPLLKSLLKIHYPSYEIVVVDDGSTDGSREKIEKMAERHKNIRIIKTLSRKGIPGSRNLGIEVSRGDLIAFFDMDMEVDKSWPGDLIKVLLRRRDVGGVLPKVLDFNRRDRIQAVGFWIDPHSLWVIPKGYGEIDEGQYTHSEEISIGAAGSIVKRDAIRMINGFDESLGMFDDIDFGWRLNVVGWKTLCVPSSVIYHWTAKPWSVRPKTSSLLEQDLYMNNLTRSLIKNLETSNLVRYFPQRVMIMFFRVILNLLKGNTIAIRGFAASAFWNLTNLRGTLSERENIQKMRKIKDSQLFGGIFIEGGFVEIYLKYLRPLIKKTNIWIALNEGSKKNINDNK